ncbi:MAG: cupin domain-containing protein [Anaerolineales bacterium]
MDWQTWVRQSLPRTDYMRGGATVWTPGMTGLLGDSLGPVMHLHDGASEIFYFLAGRCRLQVGDAEEIFEPGDFVLVPPEVPHNVLTASDDDLLVFWLVAPHFQANQWRTEGFPEGAMQRGIMRGHVAAGAELPSDDQIESQLLTLADGGGQTGRTSERQEAVLYLVDGQAEVRVGKLSGRLGPHEFVHVPVDTEYGLDCRFGPALILLFRLPRGGAV